MRFGSVCSGIEAASVAWHPLGWKAAWLSEIEPFPSAVLAHHYPDVPNLGDMTTLPEKILSGEVEAPDVFCGGTPCQAFSVAGLRNSLDDARGNLSLTFVGIANAIDHVRSVRGEPASIVFWENVPGVLSTKDNAFGCFLAGIAGEVNPVEPPRGKWTNAGYVLGPKRAVAWRVLDAQYFGVAQRRKRVFVVASARADFDPAAVLFEFDGVRRDIAPSRETGKAIAPCVTNGPPFSRTGDERVEVEAMVVSIHPHCIGRAPEAGPQGKEYLLDGSAYCMDSSGQPQAIAIQDVRPIEKAQNGRGWNDDGTAYTVDTHATQGIDGTTHGLGCGSSSGQESIAVAQSIIGGIDYENNAHGPDDVTGPLLKGSPTGGGRPLPAIAYEALYNQGFNHWSNHASTQEANTGKVLRTLREAIGEEAFAKWGLGILNTLQPPEILRQALHGLSIRPATFSRSWVVCCALGCPIYGSGWLLQSLREIGSEGCPSQGWEPPEQLAGELRAYLSELSQPGAQAKRFMCDLWSATQGAGILREALSAVQKVGRPAYDKGQSTHGAMQVRRLTPEEAEFLQGFPRGYTNIPWRKKDESPDGPRYKALGNSWAVPVVAWIGKRIQENLK